MIFDLTEEKEIRFYRGTYESPFATVPPVPLLPRFYVTKNYRDLDVGGGSMASDLVFPSGGLTAGVARDFTNYDPGN